MSETQGIIGIIVLAILFIIIGPIVTIWAWNVLFGSLHTIELNLNTWLAVAVLGIFFSGSNISYRSKK